MLKKIDILILKGFVGPFLGAFVMALFILILQFLWLYIDEIAGKGVGILIMTQLLSYLSVATFPMALPIAILISSVMVIGTAAEHYELSSMKSAGISLLRIIRSLIVVGALISVFSYVCSDFLIPIANLGFKSRLTDIRRQKPSLALEEGVFNADFNQMVIRIGKKFSDNETIKDVLIEESKNSRAQFSQVLADSGRMFTTADERFFVMQLYNGTQYQEPTREQRTENEKAPFTRTSFKEWTKVFDLSEFDMKRTDEERFSNQRSMMSMEELRNKMDSLRSNISSIYKASAADMTLSMRQKLEFEVDTAKLEASKKQAAVAAKAAKNFGHKNNSAVPVQNADKPLSSYSTIMATFPPHSQEKLKRAAQSTLRGYKNTFLSKERQVKDRRRELIKIGYELYNKYTFALVCFIFMFIGCSMGAFIRKGGFGYSVLVSIGFFVLFIFLTIACRKLADAERMTPFWAAMMPCIVLAPIAAGLTYYAMRDGTMPTIAWEALKPKWLKSTSNAATS